MVELKTFTNLKNEKTKLLKRNSMTNSFSGIYSSVVALVLAWMVSGNGVDGFRYQHAQFRLRHNLGYVAGLAVLIDENIIKNNMRKWKFIEIFLKYIVVLFTLIDILKPADHSFPPEL